MREPAPQPVVMDFNRIAVREASEAREAVNEVRSRSALQARTPCPSAHTPYVGTGFDF